MERTAFLDRLRQALPPGEVGPSLPLSFPSTPASGSGDPSEDLAERFLAELAKQNGLGRVVTRDELSGAVADVAQEIRGSRRTVVTADTNAFDAEIRAGLTAAHAEIVDPAPGEWRTEAAQADLGVTSAVLACAATGSILIAPGPASPRVASLLPAAHLAILPADRIVPGFEEVMTTVAELAASSSSTVLITGPSRTTDIEMTTVFGVHGPRVLRVLLVTPS
jgi:L-lactate dehydrogenase complex protein LldG